MREQLYNDIMTRISEYTTDANAVSNIIIEILDKYEISNRERSVVQYEDIPSCVKTYIVAKKIEGKSIKTLELYMLHLKLFFQTVRMPVEKIKPNDLRLYLYEYQQRTHITDRTLDSIRIVISAFFKWAFNEGYITTNPCANIGAIKYQPKQREPLSEQELELLRHNADTIRDQAIIEFFASTGCRVSEVANCLLSDVNLDTRVAKVIGKGNKPRDVYLSPRCVIVIREYLNTRTDSDEHLFVTQRKPYRALTKSAYELIVDNIAKASGIQRKVYPHLIRHTTATMALNRGMEVTKLQKMLGHASIGTTMIYAKVSDESVKQMHSKCII